MTRLIKASEIQAEREEEDNRICKRHAAKWQDGEFCRGCYLTPEPEAKEKGKRQGNSRQYTPTGDNGGGYTVTPGNKIDRADFAAYLASVMNDPIKYAQFMAEGRRPGTVSRAAYGVALRSAARIPMLNADPSETRHALEGKHHIPKKARLDKLKPFKRLVVKPNSTLTGKHGWQERMWSVHNLKYSRGVVAVTDEGEETLVFPDYGSLISSIRKSGWQIIREDVKKGGNTR